jgi:hypothetical protein
MSNHYLFFAIYSAATFFCLLLIKQLNKSASNEEKFTYKDYLLFLLNSYFGAYLFYLSYKIYLILGLVMAIVVVIMYSLNSNEFTENQVKDFGFFSTLWLCFLCMLLWVQIICFNYLIVKKRGLFT